MFKVFIAGCRLLTKKITFLFKTKEVSFIQKNKNCIIVKVFELNQLSQYSLKSPSFPPMTENSLTNSFYYKEKEYQTDFVILLSEENIFQILQIPQFLFNFSSKLFSKIQRKKN